jgi:serine/threonine-protein kinase RsbT
MSIDRGKGPPKTLLVLVRQEEDIVRARLAAGDTCRALGFSELTSTKVMTAVSELARNIFKYAGEGQIAITPIEGTRPGVEIMACDQGPGIKDIEAVLRDSYRSRTGMGAGLKGARRLMDSFQIESNPGRGTMVVVRKFKS